MNDEPNNKPRYYRLAADPGVPAAWTMPRHDPQDDYDVQPVFGNLISAPISCEITPGGDNRDKPQTPTLPEIVSCTCETSHRVTEYAPHSYDCPLTPRGWDRLTTKAPQR